MKKLETKGRSRKQRHHLFHKEMKQMKRLLSVCLCTSMISTSIGSTTALAATAPLLEKNEAEEENQNFVLDQEELSEALLKAVKGKPVKEDALTFEGEESEAYETLFQEDGSLFELHPDVKAPDGKVNLKVYARLDEKEDLDHYTITGEEEILFLLLNRSSEKEYGQIEVDGKRSGKVSILSSKELKTQIQDEEMAASEETGVSISNGAEEKSNKTAGESEKKENVKETDSQEPEKENPVETPEKVDKSENPASEPEKGSEAENPANKAENGAEAENPANEPEKSQEAGSGAGDAGKTGTPEEKDSQPDADSGSENEKNDSAGSEAGDVAQVSRSDHFKMFLTAAPATASEIKTEDETSEKETNTADQPDAETEVEIEDGAERLEGETYESVLLKNTAAAAFVTTAAELGLSGSVDDAVYTVNTDSAVLTLTVPAGAFEEKVKLKAEEIKDGSEEHQTLSDQIHEEGYRADSFTAFDVKFVNEAGEEVEPSEEVKVSIQFKKNAVESETGENLEETKILHIHEDVITELSEVEIQDSTEDSEKTAKLTFGVNEFSILLALNEAAAGVAEVNGTAYDTLEAAFAAADDGDTVKVLKNCGLSKAVSVDKALTLDLNGKVVKVKVVPEAKAKQTISAFAVAESVTFTVLNGLLGGSGKGADNRAIEANGGTVILRNTILAGFQALSGNGGAVLMNGGTLEAEKCNFGYFTREDNNYKEYSGQGNFAQSGGAVYTSQAAVKMEKCNLFYNSAIDMTGTTGQYWFGGGALFADRGTVTLNENYFFSNTSKDYGGAIHLDAVQTAELTGNRIRNSHAYNHRITEMAARGGDGGAIYSRISKTVTLKNNVITENSSMGNGAGLWVLGAADCVLTLEGNTIAKNEAGQRGGGIATNSPVVIGMEYADVAVEVTKKWTEETHPDHVYVDLYRVGDTSGEKVKLDSHAELNAENNWSASFEDLPSKCVSNGEVEDCHYIVEEETLEGWKGSSSTEYDKENKTYHITLTNAPIRYGSLTVSKEVTGSGDKEKAFTFKVTLQGGTALNGNYGDMEFVDNVATFTLKHGESKSAAGLPEGTAYTVEESGNEGYTVTKTGDVGTIAGGETAVVKFVNAMSGGDNPTPTPGGHGGHGGGSGFGSKKSSTTTASGPAAEPTEPVTPVEPEPQPVVPEEGLPKTGEDQMNVPMTALTVGMMAAAYVLMTGRKKTEE